jgi:hypothetical protein
MGNKEYHWVTNNTQDHIDDMIDMGDPFYFQYDENDYLIEGYIDSGFMIVEPFLYYEEGGWPKKTKAAYQGHLEAKTPDEFKKLPFLDGKTLFERWDELRFFDY